MKEKLEIKNLDDLYEAALASSLASSIKIILVVSLAGVSLLRSPSIYRFNISDKNL